MNRRTQPNLMMLHQSQPVPGYITAPSAEASQQAQPMAIPAPDYFRMLEMLRASKRYRVPNPDISTAVRG
jgi:hypothetical protein